MNQSWTKAVLMASTVACVLINHDFSFVSSLWLCERLEVSVVWDVSECCIVDMYQRLVGICCFLLQGGRIYFIFPSAIRNLKYRLHAHTSHIYTCRYTRWYPKFSRLRHRSDRLLHFWNASWKFFSIRVSSTVCDSACISVV